MTSITSRLSRPRPTSASLARRLTTAAVLAAVVLGVSACSSSSTGTTTTKPASSTPTTAPSGSTTPTTAATTSSQPSTASLSQIESKLSDAQSSTFVADYTVNSTQSGVSNTAAFTIAHDGTKSLFSIVETKGSFEEFGVGTTDTICAKTGSKWTCYSGSLGAEIGASLTTFLADFGTKAALAELTAAAHGSVSSRTVDGQTATCATFNPTTGSGSDTVCITSQGVLAEETGTNAEGTFSLKLTSLSTSVPSNEFTLPATPTTLP